MDIEKFKIELSEKEIEIVNELNDTKNKISELEAKNLNNDLLESIKTKSIETITIALGVSDILEKRAHSNGLEADKEYKRYQKWQNAPKESRTKTYTPKYLHKNEFNKIINTSNNLNKYNSKEDRQKYLGSEFHKRKNELYKNEKPLSVKDVYTGNKVLKFDDEKNKRPNVEHVRPIKEIHNDVVMNQYTTQHERIDYANSKENTCLIREDINKSKNGTYIEDTKEWAINNKERFGLDIGLIDDKIKKTENKREEILQVKKIKYKLEEKTQIATSNALKSGVKAAVGQLLTITITETIDEFKNENSTDDLKVKVKNISERIKTRASELIKTFKDFSINSFISTFLDALLNSIFKIFKNILKFIKTAFYSIMKAFKVLLSSKYTKEEKLVECRKILGATVATLIGLALEELIQTALITALPFTAPFAGYVSPVLAGLIVGIGSVLLMQGWEEYKDNIELTKLKKKEGLLEEKSEKLIPIKTQISDIEATESIKTTFSVFQNTLPLISLFKENIETSLSNVREIKDDIIKKIDEGKNINKENNDLLNMLDSI